MGFVGNYCFCGSVQPIQTLYVLSSYRNKLHLTCHYLSLPTVSLHKPVTAFPFPCQHTLPPFSLTSTQHFLVQGCEAGQFEHTGWDVGPESHCAERWLTATFPQRCDVQAGHLMLHLRSTKDSVEEIKNSEKLPCTLCESELIEND